MSIGRGTRRLAAVVLLASLTPACSAPGEPRLPARQARVWSDVAAVPRERVRDGGTLRLPVSDFPVQWNVWHLGGTDLDTVTILRTMLPALFRADRHGGVTADPDYLAAAHITRTRPKQVVTYDINPRARWSDGTPIGYRDFRALWRACRGRNPAYRIAASTGYDRIENVARGSGDRQVVVTFARPFGDWRSLFSPLYPAAEIGTPGRWDTAWLHRIPVTAGPFKPERIDRTAETVSVVRDPAWWGAPAKLDRVVFRHLARDAMPGAFAGGEIDAFDVGADAAAYRRARTVPSAVVRAADGPGFTQLTFNGASPMLSDVGVRRAVALAIDRTAVVRSALAGLGRPVRVLNDHVYVHAQRGYRDNAGPFGRYAPERARRLLDRAGWRAAGGVRRRDGRTLTLRYVFPAGAAVSRRLGELIQAMLARVGVAVTVRPVPDGDFFGALLRGDYDLAPFSWIGTPFPICAMRPVYGRPRGGDLQQNLARVGSARLDAAIDRAIGELNPARARRYADEADVLIWAEMHSLPLYQRPQIVAVKANIANWGAFGFADPVWTDVGFTT